MKYEITNEVKVIFGRTLYRIKAIKSFANVVKGELGSRCDFTTFYKKSSGNEILVNCGCFTGTIEEFEK